MFVPSPCALPEYHARGKVFEILKRYSLCHHHGLTELAAGGV